jgi:hypothetical protein
MAQGERGEKMINTAFIQECKNLVENLIGISKKSRTEGLLSLEELIDQDKFLKGNILDVGLRLLIDGVDCEHIEEILTNLINLETDKEKKFLENIVKRGIIAIQKQANSAVFKLLLNSYANIEIEETLKFYNDKLSEYLNGSPFLNPFNSARITDLITGTLKDLKIVTDTDGKKLGIATLVNNNYRINIILFSNVLENYYIEDGMKIAVRGNMNHVGMNQSFYWVEDLKLLKEEEE